MDASLPAGLTAPQSLRFRAHVVVEHSLARLGDVVDLAGLPAPLRLAAQNIPVASSRGSLHQSLEFRVIAARARTTLPALYPWLATPPAGRVDIEFSTANAPEKPEPSAAQGCVTLQHDVPAGKVVGLDDVVAATCQPGRGRGDFSYDPASGVAVARRNLAAGETSGPAALAIFARVKAGQRLVLRSSLGPVQVERDAYVIRSARADSRVLVRTGGRETFVVDQGDLAP